MPSIKGNLHGLKNFLIQGPRLDFFILNVLNLERFFFMAQLQFRLSRNLL